MQSILLRKSTTILKDIIKQSNGKYSPLHNFWHSTERCIKSIEINIFFIAKAGKSKKDRIKNIQFEYIY